jgi:hypothetical protein
MLKKIALLGTAILVMGSKISPVEESTPTFTVSVTTTERDYTPHDDIILLPKLVVRPPDAPVLGEREVYTQKSLDELLLKRFPGASFKGQPAELDNYARLMARDEVRLARLNQLKEVVNVLQATGDRAGSKELRAEIYQTFLRRPTWREEGMDRTVNRNRR